MAGTGGGGSGCRGGDNNEERLRKMVSDHLRASELFVIDTRTLEGLASLTTILGQALQAGLNAGEAQREEARKAAKAKAAEKKRNKDERATTGALSPRTLEKKRRKDERDAIRKEKLDLKKKEEEKKLPLITLAEEGILTELAYTRAKSTIKHIVSTNFARGVEWGTLSKAEQKRVINQVKGAF
jgi:hypothetical protein